jgi:threo-3-hydroxy-L-aspartate ammonia-lyase
MHDTATPPALPTFADVEVAARRLEGVAHRTPVVTSRTVNERTGAQVFFKCENLQRAGAFKFRGAYSTMAALSPKERARGVLAFSSGNHAQAIALAGSLLGVATTIVMPRDAPEIKVDATRGYGAQVIFYDRHAEDREAIARRLTAEHGFTLIPPYDHPGVIAGQGTATLELFSEVGPLDALFVCLGGGGLLAGAALVAAQLAPGCRVIGVEPEAGNDGQQSLATGRIVHIPVPDSIADGALTLHLGEHNFPILREKVTAIVTVSDAQLVETMKLFAERLKLIVEPTGCLAAAAVLSGAFHHPGERIGVLLSGGNIDLKRFAQLVA